ncbi:MAG: DUF6428 family protein [Flavobacteriaceae bacterium]|nr:DUF6428 family protein [Flavobacteriaceae bacterium]
MKISQIKEKLKGLESISFRLPDGSFVPAHFHVTEVGRISKHYIDCGGTVRREEVAGFQLWEANDYDHRLHPEKLVGIIELSERILGLDDLEIEVEYQAATIGKFGLDFDGSTFLLTTKHTDCLAKDYCGTDQVKPKIRLSDLQNEPAGCCSPNIKCC